MRQRKLKWADPYLESSPIVLKQNPINLQKEFNNGNKIEIEIGCGKGMFIISKAKANPNINYVGIDIQRSVLAIAAKKAEEEELSNVRFAYYNADTLASVVEDKIDNIYLNFSDPWPKARHAKRRLTSPLFLNQYDQILKIGGKIYFRTDNQGLYEYSTEIFNESSFKVLENIADCPLNEGDIISEYETKFRKLGQPINKITVVKEK